MEKESIKAQLIYDEVDRKTKLENELKQLAPDKYSNVRNTISTIALALFVFWAYPEVLDQPVLFVIAIIAVWAGSDVYHVNKRTNRRIDVLYELLKEDK